MFPKLTITPDIGALLIRALTDALSYSGNGLHSPPPAHYATEKARGGARARFAEQEEAKWHASHARQRALYDTQTRIQRRILRAVLAPIVRDLDRTNGKLTDEQLRVLEAIAYSIRQNLTDMKPTARDLALVRAIQDAAARALPDAENEAAATRD